jgi:hypothetical protein
MAYGISNTEERTDSDVINACASRLLDAVQKNLLLNPHAHRTKTNRRRKNTEHSMTSPSPVVGDWYRRPGGALFEVVAIDRDDATVEVQHFDGTLEEVELESWAEQEFEAAQAPEDWTGSVDVDSEDYEAEREVSSGTLWTDPLTSLDRSEASGYSEWPSPRDL